MLGGEGRKFCFKLDEGCSVNAGIRIYFIFFWHGPSVPRCHVSALHRISTVFYKTISFKTLEPSSRCDAATNSTLAQAQEIDLPALRNNYPWHIHGHATLWPHNSNAFSPYVRLAYTDHAECRVLLIMAIAERMISAHPSGSAHTACMPLYNMTTSPRITSFAAAAASNSP
jgi:hypothetical protein